MAREPTLHDLTTERLSLLPASAVWDHAGFASGERHHEESHRGVHWHFCLGPDRLRRSRHRRNGQRPTAIDILGIASAFGLTIVAMAYGIGQVSGYHINPAVSFGVLVAGRMTVEKFITYVVAQVLGAIAGALAAWRSA